MDSQIEEFDDLLATMAGRLGSIDSLLDSFFSFLHRRTDFYIQYNSSELSEAPKMGFPIGVAEEMLLRSFRKRKLKDYVSSVTHDHEVARDNTFPQSELTKLDAASKIDVFHKSVSGIRTNDEGKQIPIGNGGIGPNYYWTQSLKDVTVYVDVEGPCRGKDINCVLTPRTIHLEAKGNLILSGNFEDAVIRDESIWNINISDKAAPQIVLSLEKTRKTWWKAVLEGDPEIDASKIDSTQKIDEYDEQTQAEIRKIVTQQRQKMQEGSTASRDESFSTTVFEGALDSSGTRAP